jgi:Trypsin-like peptidase domain
MKLTYTIITCFLVFLAGCKKNPSQSLPTQPSPQSSPSTQPKSTQPISSEELRLNSKKITVLIGGKGTGTGVIVGRQGSYYYVLTSKHVVGVAPGTNINMGDNLGPDERDLTNSEDPYKVIAYNGEKYDEYEIKYKDIVKDNMYDLAILKFESDQNYSTAELAISSLDKDKNIYLYGFKNCADKSVEMKHEFNQGKMIPPNIDNSDEGYTVKYTNPTILGMSGSPVFDEVGRVVALHGKPGKENKDREYDFQKCPKLTDYYGGNYGIPMKTLKESKLLAKISVKLIFDDKTVEGEKAQSSPVANPSQESPSPPPNRPIFKHPGS